MTIAVLGAGAFGTSLAIALARADRTVTLCARDAETADSLRDAGENRARLPGTALPAALSIAGPDAAATAQVILLAVPMQTLAALLDRGPRWSGQRLIACCKGIDLASGDGPVTVIERQAPNARAALLSGPGFAVDIAAGLPTALTVAARDDSIAAELQDLLSTPALRLYRSTDVAGVELGGALKNVIAIACGMAIGAGLGESARAALISRGFAEMNRLARARNVRPETLAGLSGLGDLVLTCTSEKSRNFSFGLRLGRDGRADPTATTEGIATARAMAAIAARDGLDMPVTAAIAAVLDGQLTVQQAANALLARPLRSE